MIAVTASGQRVLDPWLALLAGDRVWVDEDDAPPDVRRRVAGGLELVALAFVASLLWVVVVQHADHADHPLWRSVIPALVATGAAAALAVRPLVLVLGRVSPPARFLRRLLWRGLAFLALIVAIAFQMPGWPAVAGWAVGVVVGADVMLSAWTLGIAPNPLRWWRLFLLSPLHFGVLGALAAVAVIPSYLPRLWTLAGPYIALHIGMTVAVVTCLGLIAVGDQVDIELEEARSAAAAQERKHRAHWLHDDVLAALRITTLRAQSGARTQAEIVADLEELDHNLRIRQVDELYAGGAARIADVLQPYVRRTQTLGVRFTAMPSLDAAGRRIDETSGRLFARAVAVLLANAVNAGATAVALGLEVEHDRIIVRLADDAGGFDFAKIPPGRGLDSLAADVGRSNVQRIALPNGSLMIVYVPLTRPLSPSDQPFTDPSTIDTAIRGGHRP